MLQLILNFIIAVIVTYVFINLISFLGSFINKINYANKLNYLLQDDIYIISDYSCLCYKSYGFLIYKCNKYPNIKAPHLKLTKINLNFPYSLLE